jgi:hypothetical protein
MLLGHLFFIPAIFLIGMVSGLAVARSRPSPGEPAAPGGTGPTVLVSSLGLFVAVLVATHFAPLPGGLQDLRASLDQRELFDQKPSFSADEAYRRIGDFGEAGRAAYRQFTYTTDLAFPLGLLVFLHVLAGFVAERVELGRATHRLLRLGPWLWFASDLVENGIVHFLLSTFPARHAGLATGLAVASVAKFSLLFVSFVLPAAFYLGARRTASPAPRAA